MTDCLSRLLLPLDTGAFLKSYQRREYLHIGRNCPGYYDDVLSVGDVDTFLQSEQLPSAFCNVVKDGNKYSLEEWSRVDTSARGEHRVAIPEKLFDLYAEGATLILNQVHRSFPSLNSVCRNLTVELGFSAFANIYVTPRGAMGFSKHLDDHEVLVLQIAGNKHWLLYRVDASVVEVDMQPGDLLYLPRGLVHSARVEDADSIHVTLGLWPPYSFQLIEELAAMIRSNDEFQQPMPPRFAGADQRRAFEATFLAQMQSVILKSKPGALLDQRFGTVVKYQTRGWPGRLSDLRSIANMTVKTIVCKRSGIATAVKEDGRFITVEFADKRVVVPCFVQGALKIIMSGNEFAVGDIEGFFGSAGKVKLVSEFVRAGLVRIVSI